MATATACTPATCRFAVKDDAHWCKVHQRMHHCGARCTQRYVGEEAQVHCKVTGRVLCAALSSHPFQRVETGVNIDHRDGGGAEEAGPFPYNKRRRARRTGHRKRGCGDMWHRQCIDIITNLLYGALRDKLIERRTRAVKIAVKRQARKMKVPCKQRHVASLVAEIRNQTKVLVRLSHDPERVQRVTSATLRVWHTACGSRYFQKHIKSIKFSHFVLGCLYIMQRGYGDDYVPTIAGLATDLPPISDIHHLGFQIKHVTIGKNHIYRAFKSELGSRGTPHPP